MDKNEINMKDIEQLVIYTNQELAKGRAIKSISSDDFNMSDDWLRKKITRKGYNKDETINQYVKEEVAEKQQESHKLLDNTNTVEEVKKIATEGEKDHNTNIIQEFNNDEIQGLKELLNIDIKALNQIVNDYTTKKNTKCIITDDKTTVTSLRLNKELYTKVKEKAAVEKIGVTEIFNKIMLDYLNK